jgi:hypothetical protein
MNFEVRVSATDWCGYDSHYTIEAEHRDEACDLAIEEFVQEWDLLLHVELQQWGEVGDFDEEGEPEDEDSLTGISTWVEEEECN